MVLCNYCDFWCRKIFYQNICKIIPKFLYLQSNMVSKIDISNCGFAAPAGNMSINYQPNGNIKNKTGLGEYTYHPTLKHALEYVEDPNGLRAV